MVGNPMLPAVWIIFSAFSSHSLHPVIPWPNLRNVCQMVLPFVSLLHPGRLTWNLQITHLERKMIFQTSMIMFHVNLPGCTFCVIPSCMSSHQPFAPSLLTPTCHHEGLGTTVLPPNLPLKKAATDTSATTASLQLFRLFPTFRQLLQMPQAAANMANKPSLA